MASASAPSEVPEAELATIDAMFRIYCRQLHGLPGRQLCPACAELRDYARQRRLKCRYGNRKPPCRKCSCPCYAPEQQRQIRQVMRLAGPRMLYRHPLLALRHLLQGLRG